MREFTLILKGHTTYMDLYLRPLFGAIPPETWFLVDENGDILTLGGDCIMIRNPEESDA